jgi:hypothetical protein
VVQKQLCRSCVFPIHFKISETKESILASSCLERPASAIEAFTRQATNEPRRIRRNNTLNAIMREKRTATRRTIQVRTFLMYSRFKIGTMLIPITSEDERSIANRLGREEMREHEEEQSLQKKQIDQDPTLPVSSLHHACGRQHVHHVYCYSLQANPDTPRCLRPSPTAMSQARVPKSMQRSRRRKRSC